MHLSFVPLTADKRLSAKDIVGNKKKLTWWQDEFWKHMVKKWPDLERGESASETGRTHIPPRLFKEAAHLNRQRDTQLRLLHAVRRREMAVCPGDVQRRDLYRIYEQSIPAEAVKIRRKRSCRNF